MGEHWRAAVAIPVGVVLVTIFLIFLISRILLAFNDQAIATGIALALSLLIMGGAVILDRRPRPTAPH